MKKGLVAFSSVVFILVAMASCKELVDKIFTGIDVNAPETKMAVPIIPSGIPSTIEIPFTQSTSFNLDSTIKAQSGGVFNISYVKSIKIKSMTISIPESDANNSLSSFQSIRVSLSSNTNSTPVEIANFVFPDVFTPTATFTATNSPELLPYLKGSQVDYTSYTKIRRGTTKPMTFVVNVLLRIE